MKLFTFTRFLGFVALLSFLNACSVSKTNPQAKDIDKVYFFQDGKSFTIADDDAELTLKRKAFAIQFFNKASSPEENDYNITRIVAVPNQEELNKIALGLDVETTVNLESGSALAVSKENGYNKELYINDYGHHILYYTNEEDHTVNSIGKKADYLLFQFEVASIFDEPNFIPIAESNLDTIYFAIFSDFNKNKIIDEGELTKIKLYLE